MKNTYEGFISNIIKELQERFEGSAEIERQTVRKNNEVELEGLLIRKQDEKLAPVIYMHAFYDKYTKGFELGAIVNEILGTFFSSGKEVKEMFSQEQMVSWDTIKSRIQMRMVNAEQNQKLLRDVPYEPFLDLAITYYIHLGYADEEFSASVQVTNKLLETWGITKEELRKQAENNFSASSFRIVPMIEMIIEAAKDSFPDGEEHDFDMKMLQESTDTMQEESDMYVFTEKDKQYGAIGFLNKERLKEFAEKIGKSFYILPSSIHKLLLLPERSGLNAVELKQMVCEVNRTQVSEEEVLSDSVYYYDFADGQIKIVA